MDKTAFDFDKIINRRGTGSYKWDTPEDPDVIPMWVADMDFRTSPAIINALEERVRQGIFGYTYVGDDYYDAVVRCFREEHSLEIKREWFIYTSGVVPAVSAIIKAMTRPGDRIIVQTPAYNCFFSSIRNNDCILAPNPLTIDRDGSFHINFEELEKLAAQEDVRLLLLCNPHNPSGRCWTRAELERVGRICLDNGVFVISDEIHCELTFGGHHYTPFASLGDEFALNSATCISPSKAFNIAGLQIANILAPDAETRKRIDKAININEVCDVNPFGVAATIAAYNESKPWLEALKSYIWENYITLRETVRRDLPEYRLASLEATYLAWLDIRPSGMNSQTVADMLLKEEKVMLNPGTMYGPEGEGFIRINLACPRTLLTTATERLVRLLKAVKKEA
ncbi:MAG: pyridoxal phosphate-dependent aminotransferase [Paramuribaculum sp.]|nr:pyridoxal phosphate-dependent aminotransferase [Paramuribaculum sp.]MDE6487915.1 pyridoxal phosphate-dependent aminotransferase [Paramuribaculum sp.]